MKRLHFTTCICLMLAASALGASAQSSGSSSMVTSDTMGSGDHMGSTSGMKMDMRPSVKSGGSVGILAPSLRGKPVVAQIHADWCPVCKAERSTIQSLRAKYGDRIAFIELDVTNAKAAAAAAEKANALGLGAFFEAHKSMTGTVAVINPRTGAVAATLYNVTDDPAYTKAIDSVAKQLRN